MPEVAHDEDALDAQINSALEAIPDAPPPSDEPVVLAEAEEEPLVSVAARGREYLMQKMREHAEKPKPVYVPPPITEKMQANINAEMEAGRRAVAKHAEQQALRPVPVKDKSEGTSTPVFRPGSSVPDPKGGNGTFSPSA